MMSLFQRNQCLYRESSASMTNPAKPIASILVESSKWGRIKNPEVEKPEISFLNDLIQNFLVFFLERTASVLLSASKRTALLNCIKTNKRAI